MTNLEKLAMNATKMRYRSGELSGEDYHKILENAKEKGSDLDRRINSKQTFREFHPDASKELSIGSKQNSLELHPYMTKEFYNKQSNRYKNYNPYRSMEDSIRVNDELERQKNILSGKIQNGVNNVRQKASDALASAGKKIKAWGNNIMNSTNTATAQPVTPNPAPATPPTSTAANTAQKNSFMRRAANAAKGVPGKIKAMPTGGKVALGAGIAGAALAGGAMLAHHNKKKKEEQMNRIASMEERLMEKTAWHEAPSGRMVADQGDWREVPTSPGKSTKSLFSSKFSSKNAKSSSSPKSVHFNKKVALGTGIGATAAIGTGGQQHTIFIKNTKKNAAEEAKNIQTESLL